MSKNNIEKRMSRKLEHIRLSVELADIKASNGFDDVTLIHQAIPELNLEDIDLSCSWLGKKLKAPILINAITGGAEDTGNINATFARVAKEYGIAMAVGSQTAALNNKSISKTFQIARKENPDGILLANISALTPYKQVLEAIEMIQADGVQLHLNILQELIMPEGDRNFKGVLDNIQLVLENSPVPVVVKEVGFGFSKESALKLFQIGVNNLDIGGYGGTNFAVIESFRNLPPRDTVFKNWGIPTAASLLEVKNLHKPIHITATGGIKTGIEVCKALRLGANIVGIAGFFLKCLLFKKEEGLFEEINQLLYDLKLAMILSGASNLADVKKTPVVFSGELNNWIKQRNLKDMN